MYIKRLNESESSISKKSLRKIISEWSESTLKKSEEQMNDYVNKHFTKEEAIRHADNIYNIITKDGSTSLLMLMLMANGYETE